MADMWEAGGADVMAAHTQLPSEFVAMCYVANGTKAPSTEDMQAYLELDDEVEKKFEAVDCEDDEEMMLVEKEESA